MENVIINGVEYVPKSQTAAFSADMQHPYVIVRCSAAGVQPIDVDEAMNVRGFRPAVMCANLPRARAMCCK
jgi:hypothetical protein